MKVAAPTKVGGAPSPLLEYAHTCTASTRVPDDAAWSIAQPRTTISGASVCDGRSTSWAPTQHADALVARRWARGSASGGTASEADSACSASDCGEG